MKFRTKLLVTVWVGFVALVALGAHGSSIPGATSLWSLQDPKPSYLLSSLQSDPEQADHDSGIFADLLMKRSREIRSDEWLFYTPLALSQLSHNPRFPVINSSFCDGQNMLVIPAAPVAHFSTIARPATWGYFFLGPQRGLAWQWWFQPAACFTALFLLLEIVLQGHQKVAALASFWFCSSAYIVCWSLWPAHLTFFGALATVSSYYLLRSERAATQWLSGICLGLSLPGFIMILYPPWQIPLAYFFLVLFVALILRDKLFEVLKKLTINQSLAIVVGLLLAALVTVSFVRGCGDAWRLMAQSDYPGHRFSTGGHYQARLLFRGAYNLITDYSMNAGSALNGNQSESASFYLLFPAVLVACLISKHLRQEMGWVGGLVTVFVGFLLFFMLVGVPRVISRITLLSYASSARMELTLGLASIILSAKALVAASPLRAGAGSLGLTRIALIGSVVGVLPLLVTGIVNARRFGEYISPPVVLVSCVGFAVAGYLVLTGRKWAFAILIGSACIVTSAFFNPLSTSLNYIYQSELGAKISSLSSDPGARPLWICYGENYPSTLVSMLGGRAIGGVHWPPQLSFWSRLDPEGKLKGLYNGLTHVQVAPATDACDTQLERRYPYVLSLKIAPTHKVLRSMGARYVLAMGAYQREMEPLNLRTIARGSRGEFSIYEIPTEGDQDSTQSRDCSLTAAPPK